MFFIIFIKNTKDVLCHNFPDFSIFCIVLIAKRSDVLELPFSENFLLFAEPFPALFFLSACIGKAEHPTAHRFPD